MVHGFNKYPRDGCNPHAKYMYVYMFYIYIPIHLPKYAFFVLFGKFLVISQCGIFFCFRSVFACSACSYFFAGWGPLLSQLWPTEKFRGSPDHTDLWMHTVFVCKQLLSGIRFRGGVDVFVKTTRIGQISGPRQIERGRL